MNDQRLIAKHTYPDRYPKDAGGVVSEAWEILDRVTPGVIPPDVRAFLAGVIAGKLWKARSKRT